jgi:hypothetical protein
LALPDRGVRAFAIKAPCTEKRNLILQGTDARLGTAERC